VTILQALLLAQPESRPARCSYQTTACVGQLINEIIIRCALMTRRNIVDDETYETIIVGYFPEKTMKRPWDYLNKWSLPYGKYKFFRFRETFCQFISDIFQNFGKESRNANYVKRVVGARVCDKEVKITRWSITLIAYVRRDEEARFRESLLFVSSPKLARWVLSWPIIARCHNVAAILHASRTIFLALFSAHGTNAKWSTRTATRDTWCPLRLHR